MMTWEKAKIRIAAGGSLTREELRQAIETGGGRTASESEKLFQACPAWVAESKARDAEMRAKDEIYLKNEAPLREALNAAGFPVKWVWDFVNAKQNYYVDAIPLLIEHLKFPYVDLVREGIVRALAMKEARGLAGAAIVEVLREEGLGNQLRWALANTLTTVADPSNRSGIKSILDSETNKEVANRLVRSLKTAAKSL